MITKKKIKKIKKNNKKILGWDKLPANMGILNGEQCVLLIILVYIILIIVQSGHCSVQRNLGSRQQAAGDRRQAAGIVSNTDL